MRLRRCNLPIRRAALMALARRLVWAVFHDHRPMTMEEMLLRAVSMGGGGLYLSLRLMLTAHAHAGGELAVTFQVGDKSYTRAYRADPIAGRFVRLGSRTPSAPVLTIDCTADEWAAMAPHLDAWEISHLLRACAAQSPLTRQLETVFRQAGPNHRQHDYSLPPLSLAASGIPLLHLTEAEMNLVAEYGYYYRLAEALLVSGRLDQACG